MVFILSGWNACGKSAGPPLLQEGRHMGMSGGFDTGDQ